MLCFGLLFYYRGQSKPVTLYLNPMSARSSMLERYMEIEKMPVGVSKIQAYNQWQHDCETLKQNLIKQNSKLKVKVVGRKV